MISRGLLVFLIGVTGLSIADAQHMPNLKCGVAACWSRSDS